MLNRDHDTIIFQELGGVGSIENLRVFKSYFPTCHSEI